MIEIDILHQAGDWPDMHAPINNTLDHCARHAQLQQHLTEGCEVSIVLTDDTHIQALNKDYRGKDKPTNVLSFPQNEPSLLGDVIISHNTIAQEASAQNKTFQDHFTHMLVHGTLHLLGYDHETETDAKKMESLEIDILSHIGVKNPYEAQ